MDWIQDEQGIWIGAKNEKLSYPEDGNLECFQLEDISPWFRYRNELIEVFLNLYGFKSGDFIDIGGGNGFQLEYLTKKKIIPGKGILVEPGYYGCSNAKKRGCQIIYNGIFQDFPWENYSVSMVGLFDVIEHIEDDIKFLNELYERLPLGARVFINVPAKMSLWSSVDVESGHFRRYELMDLERIESQTPFKIMDRTFYFRFFELPLFAARVIPEKLGFLKHRSGDEQRIKDSNNKNLRRGNSGILSLYFNYRHSKLLKSLKLGKRINSGTSLFFVLEK